MAMSGKPHSWYVADATHWHGKLAFRIMSYSHLVGTWADSDCSHQLILAARLCSFQLTPMPHDNHAVKLKGTMVTKGKDKNYWKADRGLEMRLGYEQLEPSGLAALEQLHVSWTVIMVDTFHTPKFTTYHLSGHTYTCGARMRHDVDTYSYLYAWVSAWRWFMMV